MTAFLDVEGAFDNIIYEVIQRALQGHCVHPEIISLVISMPKNRVPAKGCPQSGVLSPLLWILVADSLLRQIISDLGFETIGYADDFVLISEGKFLNTVTIGQKLLFTDGFFRYSNLVLFTKNRNLQGTR